METQKEITELFEKLPPEDCRLLCNLMLAVQGMTEREKEIVQRFMDKMKGKYKHYRAAMEVVTAAGNGSEYAWRIIKKEIRRKPA